MLHFISHQQTAVSGQQAAVCLLLTANNYQLTAQATEGSA